MIKTQTRGFSVINGMSVCYEVHMCFCSVRDKEKKALQVAAINLSQEDYGSYILFALPQGKTTLETLLAGMDEEIENHSEIAVARPKCIFKFSLYIFFRSISRSVFAKLRINMRPLCWVCFLQNPPR